ncbi:very short patch repair endonuclease [Methylopila sp. M107]|uniref:very short patch repair endonuclease n=1 Tax=Methylopila sp. M107 TaxID=1101190 RepID=UPI00036416C6|nr:very short patch repair endonuclease [Methylopila sp. M107]
MTDPARSAVMRAVKSRDTGPEMLVRRVAHALGFRFRLHRTDLPGSPDLVFPRAKTAVFVHGCFWHGHDCPRGARVPKTNVDYWRAKIGRNVARDARVRGELEAAGWRTLTLWECELKDRDGLEARLRDALGA